MRALAFAALVLLPPVFLAHAAPALAQSAFEIPSGTYVGDPTHSSITFKISHFGLSNYTARFTKFDSAVTLDAANPAASALKVDIDTNSVRTDYPFPAKEDFDKVIGSEERFLNGAKFPRISFVSKSIRATGPRTAQITGDLTLRGVTKSIVLDTVLNGSLQHPMRKVPMFGISATAKINRNDFGLTFGKGFLGDDVNIIVEAELAPAAK